MSVCWTDGAVLELGCPPERICQGLRNKRLLSFLSRNLHKSFGCLEFKATLPIMLPSKCNLTMSSTAGEEIAVPFDFVCPITLQVMVQPLTTREGLRFERLAILSWLETGSCKCPLTRKVMSLGDLIPDRALEIRIQRWKAENGIPEEVEGEETIRTSGWYGFVRSQGDGKVSSTSRPSKNYRRGGQRTLTARSG